MTHTEEIIERERRFLLPTYNRYPIALERGKGVFLYDREGKRYLDFVAGLGVNALGHAHPRIVKAIREQAARAIHLSNLYYNEYQGRLAEKLCQLSGLDRAFFSNSGTEAIEGSIKLARLAGHRAGGEAKSQLVALRRLVSRTNFRRDVAHRAGQIPQGIRTAARRRQVCSAQRCRSACAPPWTTTPAPSCSSRSSAKAESTNVQPAFFRSAVLSPTATAPR